MNHRKAKQSKAPVTHSKRNQSLGYYFFLGGSDRRRRGCWFWVLFVLRASPPLGRKGGCGAVAQTHSLPPSTRYSTKEKRDGGLLPLTPTRSSIRLLSLARSRFRCPSSLSLSLSCPSFRSFFPRLLFSVRRPAYVVWRCKEQMQMQKCKRKQQSYYVYVLPIGGENGGGRVVCY